MKKTIIVFAVFLSLFFMTLMECDTDLDPSQDVIEVSVTGWGKGADEIVHAYVWEAQINMLGEASARAVDGPEIEWLEETLESWGLGVARSDDATLVTGRWLEEVSTEVSRTVPCVWTNGTRTDLPLPTGTELYAGYTSGIDTGSVYISGFVENQSTHKMEACYWKDGVLHILEALPENTMYSQVSAVQYVPGDALYLAGSCITSGGARIMCYWTVSGTGEETRHDLAYPEGVQFGNLYNLFVDTNGDVYICGVYYTSELQTACYWKNGTVYSLATGEFALVKDIATANGHVLAVGWTGSYNTVTSSYDSIAHIWKDGSILDLSAENSGAAAILIVRDNVIVSGYNTEDTEQAGGLWILPGFAASSAKAPGDEPDYTILWHALFWRWENVDHYMCESSSVYIG